MEPSSALLNFLFQGVSSITFFTARPIASAFGMALIGRLIADSGGVPMATSLNINGFVLDGAARAGELPLLLGNVALGVLLILALIELYSFVNEDLRYWYDMGIGFLQPGSAFVVNYSYADWELSSFVEMVQQHAAPALALGGPGTAGTHAGSALALAGALALLKPALALIWAGLLALGAWLLGRVRASLVELVNTVDEGNALGLQTVMRWVETSWVAAGVVLMVVLPLATLVLAGLAVAAMFAVRRYFEHRERQMLQPCAHCGQPVLPTAPACSRCRQPQAQVQQVGVFGQPTGVLAADMAAHRLALVGRRRCPACATRLPERAVRQACPACGTITFADTAAVNVYLRALAQRLPKTLLFCFLFGLVPVVGIVPGVIYYRLNLIASLKGYVPPAIGCVARWGIRLGTLVLLGLQWVPLLGSVMLPAMCLLNFVVYRKVIERVSAGTIGHTFTPLAAPVSGGAVAVAPATTAAECASCGAENLPGYQFCAGCGARLG